MIVQMLSAKIENTSFPKESVENADLYKLVWNKIMTTLIIKYNFVTPSILVSAIFNFFTK